MITANNYFSEIKKVTISKLPKDFRDAHDLFKDATEGGKDMSLYKEDKEIKQTIDLYVKKLNAHLKKQSTKTSTAKPKSRATRKPKTASKPKPVSVRTTKTKTPKPRPVNTSGAKNVESVNKEIQLIRRFVNMIGQKKNKRQILLLLNMVQKYLFERRARRVYKYAEELEQINEVLSKAFQKQASEVMIKVSKVKESNYRKIAGSEVERIAIQFIKSYISLQGKTITKEKVKRLYNRIADAVNDGKLTKRNRHWKHVERILDSLKNYYHNEILTIHRAELNGLQGIVNEEDLKKKS